MHTCGQGEHRRRNREQKGQRANEDARGTAPVGFWDSLQCAAASHVHGWELSVHVHPTVSLPADPPPSSQMLTAPWRCTGTPCQGGRQRQGTHWTPVTGVSPLSLALTLASASQVFARVEHTAAESKTKSTELSLQKSIIQHAVLNLPFLPSPLVPTPPTPPMLRGRTTSIGRGNPQSLCISLL